MTDPENGFKDKPLVIDTTLNQFCAKMDDEADTLHGSITMNALNNNDNLETNISRNLFSEKSLENGSGMTHDMEYLMSSTEENKETSSKTSFEPSISTPNGNGDVNFEPTDDIIETFTISCHAYESLGIVLGMNEVIDASEGEVRKVYVKKISGNGAMTRAMNESNSISLGDEILAINESCIKNLSRNECLNLLINLPNEITLLLKRNTLPWTTGPRCSFYLNLVDKNPESILSPAPKLFTNEGKKIPDGYNLLEISLYKEASDLLGISIVPSYGDTRHYYQIKELEADGICSKSKLLNKGDCLVSCNGNSLYKIPFNQCLNILKSEGPSLTFEVFRKDDIQTTLEFHETQATNDDNSEVNNNNNNGDDDDENENDGRSASTYTSELLIPSEVKLTESIKPLLETNKQENLLDFTNFSNRDSKTAQDNSNFEASPDLSDSKASLNLVDLGTLTDLGGFKASTDLGDFKLSPDLGDLRTSPDLSELSDSKISPDLCDFKASPDLCDLKTSLDLGDLRTSPDLSELSDSKLSPDLCDFKASADFGDSKASPDFGDFKPSADLSDFKPSADLSDFEPSADLGDFKASADFGDLKASTDLGDFKASPDISDFKVSPDISDFRASADPGDFKASPDISDFKPSADFSDFKTSPDISDFKVSADLSDFKTSPDISDFKASADLGDFKASPDISDFRASAYIRDFKTSTDLNDLKASTDLGDFKASSDICDFKPLADLSDFKPSADLSDFKASTDLGDFKASTDISDFEVSPDISDFKASADLGDFKASQDISDFNPSVDLSDFKPSADLSDFKASADLSDLKASTDLCDFKASPDISDFKVSADLSDFKTSPDISDFKASADLGDFKASPDIGNFKVPAEISDFKASPDFSDFKVSADISNFKASPDISNFKASPDISDFKPSADLSDFKPSADISDFKASADLSDFKVSPDLSDFKASPDICDFKASPDISDFKASTDISDFNASPDISDSPNTTKSHLSSFECEVNNTLNKPLPDFLTESPFTESPDIVPVVSVQKPIEACPAETTLHPVIDEPCIQLTAEAVESSPPTDRSSQSNMSEQCPANDAFSLDGLEEFSNSVINNANELNNNFSSSYPCSSNEDLISIDTDVLSPTHSNPTLIFYNHADPWEAAGEAKSENLLPDFQMSQSINHKNALNEFIDSVESPDYGSDPLDGLQENIMQVTHVEKCLSSPPTKFGTDLSKGHVRLDNDSVEEERTSPISYDDSLSGSIGIHTADEGDIPVSSRNSDSELIEEMPQSPDSGRADSPVVYKNNSYDQKEIIPKLPFSHISVDIDKMTEEENSVYHTVSDISRKNKGSENHGSFDSSESCATSVGSFESCAETGEQDHLGSTIPKHLSHKNEDLTKSLPRNAFSNFKEFQNSMIKSSNEKSSTLRSDARLFPLSASMKSNANYDKSDYLKKFSDNLFSRNYRLERKSDQVRSEDKPFQVEVLKGIVGLGMTLKVDDEGFVKVTHIQNNTPAGQNGIIKVGDYILSINNTNIVGVSDSRVQQILRLLPRGLIKVVASAVPISDWKQDTEDAEKLSVGNSGTSRVTVSLTSPIKMPNSFSSNLSGRGLNTKATSQKKSTTSFSSSLNVFSKEQSKDTTPKLSPTTAPSISTPLQKKQWDKTETCVKSSGFSNNSRPSLPLDKNLNKYNSSYEQSPVSSPEVVLNQVRMFENYHQKKSPNQEIKEPVVSSNQKLVEMFEPRNQKQLIEKDNKEALPDILQDHTNSIKKQFCQEVKNGNLKSIAKSYDASNKTPAFDNNEPCEDLIVPVKTNKYRTFSSLPRSSSPRILDSYSMWDNMDTVTKKNQNTVSQVKKTVSQVFTPPEDPIKEELIIPKKKASVQSLVNQFNSPQNSDQIGYSSNVSRGFKATGDRSRSQSPAVVEESIEPIRKARITNMSKPLPISFSEVYDIDEVLIIEKTEKKNAKPDLKMTLTGPYSATVEVSEPQLKPEKKPEVKSMKRPVASPRKSYNLTPTRTPKNNSVKGVSEPEVSIGIARRLSPSAVPDCIDIINIPEMVPTDTAFNAVEEEVVRIVRPNRFEKLIESPKTKRAKAISLLGSIHDDIKFTGKQELKVFDSDRKEINEDQITPSVKVSAMSAKPRKITTHLEDAIVPVVRKSKARKYAQSREISRSSSSEDLNCQPSSEVLPRRTLKFANNKANEIVKSVIEAAEKELCRTSVNKPSMAICDITGHTPCDEETDHPVTSKSDSSEENVSQIEEPSLFAEIKTQKQSSQKRNLPLIENGRPKPMPRQSRQLSPSTEISSDIFGEKAVQQSPLYQRSKSEIQPSNPESDTDSRPSVRLHSPVPFRRSVSPSGGFRKFNENDSNKKLNFFSAPSSPMREQKPGLFKQTSPGCLESLLNSELQNSSRGRSLPSTPRHHVSRCLPNTPTEENKFVGRSLPSVPVQTLSSFSGHQIEFKTKTYPSQPVLSQVTSTKFVSQSVQLQDAPMDKNTNITWTSHQEFPPVESPVCQQETHQMEESTAPWVSPVPATKSVSLFTNQVAEVERVPSPVSLQQSLISWPEDRQTEQEAPIVMNTSFTLNSAVKTQPLEESEVPSDPVSTSSLSTDSLESESPKLFNNVLDIKETSQNNLVSLTDNLPEVKSEINIPPLPTSSVPLTNYGTDGVSTPELISVKRPQSLATKPLDFKKETLTLSSPVKILNSAPVLPEVGEKSPVLASPIQPSRNITENHTPSPTSRSSLNLEATQNASPISSPGVSPRRIGSTNRKLPDIFQSTHTFKTLSSPTRGVKTSPPSEYVPIEKNVSEHKSQKITEVSNSEVVLSRCISVEPKTTSELKDPKLKTHSVEITESIPKAEVAVSQCINIAPTRASALSEVKTEKHSVQVIDEVSKPEVAVSQFIGVEPTTAISLPEKKVKAHDAAVVEEIAKPEVAVSQFIGIKPTTTSNLPSAKESKENKVEISLPENRSVINVPSINKQEQNVEVVTGIKTPKSEVVVSKFIGLQPTTATKLDQSMKRSVSTDDSKSLDRLSSSGRSRLSSSTKPDLVTSVESARPSFSRHKSTDTITSHVQPTLRNSRSGNKDSFQMGTTAHRRGEKVRPKSEICPKEMPSIFSKRKWCISTKSGQTNFALPSDPATIDRVIHVGLIDEEDLDHLITSANLALDKMSFSNNEEIHIAIMEKDATEKTGIKLKKGEKQELVISLLEPDGAAIKQKFIHVGDSLLLVNGKPVWNQTVMDVKMSLQTIETRMIFVLSRPPMDDDEAANDCEYMDVVFQKGVTGVGFCLEGGVGCPLGDRPISVKRIFKGGPAEKGGKLMVGDEILKVNDMDFQKQRHFVAWNHLKFLPEGDVKLHICRRKSHVAATKAAALQEANTDSTTADTSA